MMMVMMIAAVVLVYEYRKKGRLTIVTVIHLRELCIFNPVVRA